MLTADESAMNLPIYCLLNGERATKIVKTEEGGISILEYYAVDDEFREGDGAVLRYLLFGGDLDVEVVTKEEFDAFVERQGAKYKADPELRRKAKITAMQNARNLVLRAVEWVDPGRARELKAKFLRDHEEGLKLGRERELEFEKELTINLLRAVADINDDIMRIYVVEARRITGLVE